MSKRLRPMPPNWQANLRTAIAVAVKRGGSAAYLDANVDSTQQVARGIGPDSTEPNAGAGLRIVFNISCKHVPDFCQTSEAAYKNAYDTKKVGTKRRSVDTAIESAARQRGATRRAEDIYFGAVEASGSGIRFYGDMCFVLRTQPSFRQIARKSAKQAGAASKELLVLNRNSYDVIRAPATKTIKTAARRSGSLAQAQADQLFKWMGSWENDLLSMIGAKVLEQASHAERRWTTGQIAQSVLSDEDYVEVLFPSSFHAKDLLEVRLSAADVAAESDIANRETTGEGPLPEELLWREQRRLARKALARAKIPVRVIMTSGRVKGS